MSSVSDLVVAKRIEARNYAVEAAMVAYHHAGIMQYTEGPGRWDGMTERKDARKGQYPPAADCSAFAFWCVGYNGLALPFGIRDTMNGANGQSGYTGTMLLHGKQVHNMANVQRADCVIYGHAWPGQHTAVVVGRRSDGKIMVISHGHPGAPDYLPYDEMGIPILQVRRYI